MQKANVINKSKKATRAAKNVNEPVSTEFVSFDGDVRLNDPYGLLSGLGVSASALARMAPSMEDWVNFENGLPSCLSEANSHQSAIGAQTVQAWSSNPSECSCGGKLRRTMSGLDHVCDDCGLIIEGDSAETEEDARATPASSRLTIVGPKSSQLQPDLYRSGTGCTADQQKKQIFEEYKELRQMHIDEGGRAFPLDACARAAEHYNKVQRVYVKRSQNKKAIMAHFFTQSCLELNFAPEKNEVLRFMRLQTRGIARGANFVRKFAADGNMDGINVDIDPCRPEIVTLFAGLGLEHPKYKPLCDAVYDIVQTAIAKRIGASSILRSKVAGAAYTVLRRCKDKTLLQREPTLTEFCKSYRIRKNTIGNMLSQLEGYHSHFQEIYAAAGLDSRPPIIK